MQLLAVGLGVAALAFALLWILSVRLKNYGFLDVMWSLSIGMLAVMDALLGAGQPLRKLAFAVLGVAWSLRLGLYILIRVLRAHPQEDKRYRTLREQWPGRGRFLLFFELQALIAVVFSLPFLLASVDTRPGLTGLEIFGLTLALCATAGEALVWWGFFMAAVDLPHGSVTLICPLLMLYLLLKVTGIPLTEQHSLESRGEAYRRYQRTTSRFVPWYRKNT
ncbi:MAG: DUF1295 domain-containing protein [Steroidobacterales bacterium]